MEGKLEIIMYAIQQYGSLCQDSDEAMDTRELSRKLTKVKSHSLY